MPSAPAIDYLAAYIDGEGCFILDTTTRIQMNNTYPDTLHDLQRRFGGSVIEQPQKCRKKEVHRTMFRWAVSGEDCRKACLELIPYLREKKAQAHLLLAAWETRKVPGIANRIRQLLKDAKRVDYGTDSTN